MKIYAFEYSETEITMWRDGAGQGGFTGTLAECLAKAKEMGLTWEEENLPEPPAREISKLVIRRRLREINKEDSFDSILDQIPHARRDWDDALVINTNDPMFTTNQDQLKSLLQINDEQFKNLII